MRLHGYMTKPRPTFGLNFPQLSYACKLRWRARK